MGNQKKLWRPLLAVSSSLLAIMLGLTAGATAYKSLVCSAIGGETFRIEDSADAETIEAYKTNGQSLADWKKSADAVVQEIEAEGAVLMKNNGVLPLEKGANVTLFSRSSVDIGMGGTGAGGIKSDRLVDLRTAMEEDGGYSVNPTIWDFYKTYDGKDGYKRNMGSFLGSKPEQVFVAEVDPAEFTAEVRASYDEYSDAAIVVITRIGGEGSDMPTGVFGDGEKYLALQQREKDLLLEIKNSGKFDKIIVLINSSNAMELGWLDAEEYGIDAALWIGGVGQSGVRSVAKILNGTINPSGRTVDTYAADSFSSPAMQNFGDYTFTNGEEVLAQAPGGGGNKYVVYREGIYVGYRYYETRYADSVTDPSGTNAKSSAGAFVGDTWEYSDEVVFPFGYGLSYGAEDGLPFTQTIVDSEISADTVTLTVEVRNDGSQAGKQVVQVYGQAPYTKGGVEKSAIQLVGFEKTEVIEPGDAVTVEVVVDKYDIASYDYETEKTYVLEEGDYYFAVGNNAHDALNNVLAKRGMTMNDGMDVNGEADLAIVWNNDQKTLLDESVAGTEVTNLFDHAGLEYYGIETGYLTRADWNTFPETYTGLSATQEMIDDINAEGTYEPGSSDISSIPTGVESGYNIAMLYGEDFTSDAWQTLIDQLTTDDLARMVGTSGLPACETIGYPAMQMKDGPAGENVNPYVEDGTYPTGFCSEVVFASTYNRELLTRVGQTMGEDWLRADTEGGYAPASNLHRTPYAGRNFEYYSEDGYLAGELTAAQVIGMQEKGMICYVKHFVLNDQETNRQGLCTFTNEQAMREIYIRAFEDGFTRGKAKGTMEAFNRIGCVWSGADAQLNRKLMREEWGWTGIIDTDIAVNLNLQAVRAGLEGGTTIFATSGSNFYNYLKQYIDTDAKLLENAREACKYLLYNISTSSGMNGLSKTAKIIPVMPYWQVIAIVACVVFGVVAAGSAVMIVVTDRKKKQG